MKRLLFAATILFSATTIAEVAIIVHPSNSNTFSDSDLKNLYLGKKKTFPDGSEAIPLNLEEGERVEHTSIKPHLKKVMHN
ncbi:hypothetical protein NI389_12050 [Pseudoalteromonas xiamenensis]|uniref:hypothetical protein n=1 Tax=Pseudoalteromonas xiamenensis TaxID=882626 RepID=UPI0027E47756|nr:hypothetical protein [Pseudoalteromonas xiamenensis]WMN58947.1 hypothetical protein NI389_12050 [Pseudoalteromonas xiamenensis]